MQLGRLEIMDQSNIDHVEKISKIETVDKEHNIVQEEQYKKLEEGIRPNKKNEVILDNVKFGFDSESKEFFVRVEHNGMEYQYPTDQFMRLKTQINKLK